MSGTKREAWRERVSRYWSWLRQKISYKAFEEPCITHSKRGMAWVFRKCRTLTPRGALLVITGAVLWLPISFGLATAMHAVLHREGHSLPAWMQLLHPLATIIAKSKLLVLPVYPAAWPQAKQHPVRAGDVPVLSLCRTLYLMRKTGYRYRQTSMRLRTRPMSWALPHRSDLASWPIAYGPDLPDWLHGSAGPARRNDAHRRRLGSVPADRAVVRSYAARYDGVGEQQPEKLSEKVSGFFARWSIHFSAEYYEAKEREEAAKRHAAATQQVNAT